MSIDQSVLDKFEAVVESQRKRRRLILRHPDCAYRQSSVPPHKYYINR